LTTEELKDTIRKTEFKNFIGFKEYMVRIKVEY